MTPAEQEHRRRFRVAAILGAWCFVALVVRSSFQTGLVWDALAGIGLGIASLAGIAIGVRHLRPAPFLRRLLLGSSALALLATLVWWSPVLLDIGPPLVKPSVADIGWLASGQCLTLAVLIAMLHREAARFVLLDILALSSAIGLVVGVLLIAPEFADGTAPLGRRITQVVYVALDVVLLSTALRALVSPRPRPTALVLLAATSIGVVISDFAWNGLTLSGTYFPGGWADLGWFVAPILMALAALHPSSAALARRGERVDNQLLTTGPALLGLSSIVLPAMIALQAFVGIGPRLDEGVGTPLALSLGGAAIGGVVATRVLLLVRKAQRLTADLGESLAEQARLLERSEARHQGLVEQLPACIYVLKLNGRGTRPTSLFVSSKVEAVTGLTTEDWMSGSLISFVHRDDKRALAAEIEAANDSDGQRPPFEFRSTGRDGVQRWLRDAGAVVTEEDGVRVMRGVLFDVSDVRQAEAQRAQMEMELNLSQKLDAVGQLAAGIAHEINTPIQFVGDTVRFLDDAFSDIGQLMAAYESLLDEARAGLPMGDVIQRVCDERAAADIEYLTERVPLAIQRAADGVNRVATIVRAMRDFAHPGTVDKKPVDLNEALRNTLVVATNEYKYVADVETDLGTLPPVLCSGGDLNQVFLNLLVNASHAIAEVANVNGERGKIVVRTRADGEHVVVSISDTGGGIPDEIAGRIYDPFFTTKSVGHGTGQGLAIARTIVVERHDGAITFESEPGVGTTFHLRLPVGDTNEAAVTALAA